MKLAQARDEVKKIEERIEFNTNAIKLAPLSIASEMLSQCDELVSRYELLSERITSTEEATFLEGNSLPKLNRVLTALDQKIELLHAVCLRSDLDPVAIADLEQQLKSFRSNRELLGTKLQRCSWETELLE